jgi:hypothetical protein
VTVSAMLTVMALAGGAGVARGLCLAVADAISFMTAFPVRNFGILAVVIVTTLHRQEYLVFVLVYFVVETALMLAVAGAYRRRRALPTISNQSCHSGSLL